MLNQVVVLWWLWNVHLQAFPNVFRFLLDDMSMWSSQIESDTSTDRVCSAQIESALHRDSPNGYSP